MTLQYVKQEQTYAFERDRTIIKEIKLKISLLFIINIFSLRFKCIQYL